MANKSIQLPVPTGSFNVGTATYYLVDTLRKEMHSDNSEHPYRELMVQVWYPAQNMGNKAEGLLSLYSQPQVRELMGKSLNELIRKKYNPAMIAQEIIEFYCMSLAKKS
ncbi:hypothetical protein KBC04_05435 [Candidatus Babeliales bacterium]|nr:hypothetical protein [Candidatus Babeliales bacterium]MBP9844362.1 hypothetical protein [Candidatus Babeliales bacterium]